MAAKPIRQSIKGKGRDIFFTGGAPDAGVAEKQEVVLVEKFSGVETFKRSEDTAVEMGTDGLDRVTLYIRSDQSLKLDTLKNQLKLKRKQKGLSTRQKTIDRSSLVRMAIDLLDEHDIEDLLKRLES